MSFKLHRVVALLTLALAGTGCSTVAIKAPAAAHRPAAQPQTDSTETEAATAGAIDAALAALPAGSRGAVKVTPQMRSQPITGEVATIPYASIASFLSKPVLLSEAQTRQAPYVVALRELHLAVGAPHSLHIRGLQGAAPGRYSIVRLGEALRDPANGRSLGYLGIPVGTITVSETAELSLGTLVDSALEAQAGDLVFAEEVLATTDFLPRAAPADVNGQIVAVIDGVSMIGQYQIVAINRGSEAGLAVGHLLSIDAAGEVTRDDSCQQRGFFWCVGTRRERQMPDQRAGSLMVFKTYPEVSYALTVNLLAPVRVADRVHAP